MDRETKEIVLPKSGDKFVVHTYITGGEELAITRFYLKTTEELDPAMIKEKGQKSTIFEETQKLAFKFVVVSVNGKKEGDKQPDGRRFSMIDYIMDLRKSDYEFLVKKINEITRDEEAQAEKKTG